MNRLLLSVRVPDEQPKAKPMTPVLNNTCSILQHGIACILFIKLDCR